jgi:hypothetical protein
MMSAVNLHGTVTTIRTIVIVAFITLIILSITIVYGCGGSSADDTHGIMGYFMGISSDKMVVAEEEDLRGMMGSTYVYLKKQQGLSPEAPELDAEQQQTACPPATEPLRPFFPGIIFRPMYYVWTELRTPWQSEPLKAPLTIGTDITLKLYLTSVDHSTIEIVKFAFKLKTEERMIANVTQEEAPEVEVKKDEITEYVVSAKSKLIEPLRAGESISIHLEYYATGDGLTILYDTLVVPSGIIFDSDAIKFHQIGACPKGVGAEFTEAFGINPNGLICTAIVDDKILKSEPEITPTLQGTTAVHWAQSNKPGPHEIEVSIGYKGVTNATWSSKAMINIKEPKESWLSGISPYILPVVAIIITIVIICIIIIIYRRRKATVEYLSRIMAQPT